MQHWRVLFKFTHGFSLRVQHTACSKTPSLHYKYFRRRQRKTWLEMNALIRWRLEPCKGIIVFCISIFSYYQWLWTKSNDKELQSVKYVCVVSSHRHIWMDREQGSYKNCHLSGQRSHRSRGRRLELLCFCRRAQCYSVFITVCRKTQGVRWPPTTCTQQAKAHF